MEYFLPFIIYSFILLVSPGPNNIMLMIIASNYGSNSVINHLLGIWTGFTLLVFLSAVGIMSILSNNLVIFEFVRYIGLIYILYIAYKISLINNMLEDKKQSPINFYQAFLFQFLNPKGWIVAITSITTFWRDKIGFVENIITLLSVLVSIGIISSVIWVLLGESIKRFLKEKYIKIITKFMAVLLAISSIYIVLFE
jgi:threonine/homoserine/homoserine lactone efflux protein